MTTQTTLQTTPYLPKQRNFPINSPQALGVEIDKTYIDIANRVNERTIGIFGSGYQIVTGEGWFLNGQPRRRQTLRQVYEYSGVAPVPVTIPHGINLSTVTSFTRIYGTLLSSGTWFPLPLVSVVSPIEDNQVSVSVDGTYINIVPGVNVGTFSGLVILEWLSTAVTNT